MKKIILTVLTLCAIFLLASCGDNHEHKFSSDWSHNDISHWHGATCEHESEKLDLAAHNWVEDKILVAPGCQTPGKQQYKCSVCKATKEVELPVLGHDHSGAWQSNDEKHWKKCENCDSTIEGEHSGGEASFTNPAECSICGSEYGDVLVLNPVTNIRYSDDILKFDEVELATGYQIIIKKNDTIVLTESTTEAYLNLTSLNLCGSYTVEVYTRSGSYTLETPATGEITILSKVEDVVLEAEIALQAFANMYKGNPLAHGGAYVGNIDNCGQGVTLDYFCYVAGEYDLEAYYMTGMEGSYHNVYVNGEKQARLDYTEITGWGSASAINTAKATTKVTLTFGWNRITVIKDGNANDNWGGYAELDFFIVKGTGVTYNVDDFAAYNLNAPSTYRLEGEQASFISRVTEGEGFRWVFSNLVPFYSENASSKYMIGGIDNIGQGLEWHLSCYRPGTYQVKVVYAHEYLENVSSISFYHSATTLRDQVLTLGGVRDQNLINVLSLGKGLGWGVPTENLQTFEIDLVEGDNFIYAIKEDGSYFQIDYVALTFIR